MIIRQGRGHRKDRKRNTLMDKERHDQTIHGEGDVKFEVLAPLKQNE